MAEIEKTRTNGLPTEGLTKETATSYPDLPKPIKTAVKQLQDDIVALGESKDHIVFLMAVNVDSAKADLVPIPTVDNMKRMKEKLERLPEAVTAALKNSIPEKDLAAVQSIWTFLSSVKALPETEEKHLLPERPETSQ